MAKETAICIECFETLRSCFFILSECVVYEPFRVLCQDGSLSADNVGSLGSSEH